MDAMKINNREIGAGQPCFIIAEAGLNHNGDPEIAKQLIKKAADCGADAIKFQTYTTGELFPPDHPDYKKFEKHVFGEDIYKELIEESNKNNIIFLSTPFDEASADLLFSLGITAYKVGSGELTHLQFLKYLARKELPMILSTGMSNMDQVDKAVQAIQSVGDVPLSMLHCVSAYPCPVKEVNVRRITMLKNRFAAPIGFSDHTESDTSALAAVVLGACIVEKHFTLSHHLPGWDHHFSYDPNQLRRFVKAIREVETSLGESEKHVTESEVKIEEIARRAIYARIPLKAGYILTAKNLIVRRPAGPISADQFEEVLGKVVLRDIPVGEALRLEDIKE